MHMLFNSYYYKSQEQQYHIKSEDKKHKRKPQTKTFELLTSIITNWI